MQKTLGGDRLGSGKKMKVELHNYERSTHDMSYLWRSTMSAGTLVPFLTELALPADTFDINLNCNILTHPTIGPLFGSYKIQLDVFLAPIRLYNALLHNNKLGIGLTMDNVFIPQMTLLAQPVDTETNPDIDNAQINPSSILSYLNIRGIGRTDIPDTERTFNAIPLLAYWEIYKQYYANKMEQFGAVIHTPQNTNIETVDDITTTIGTNVQTVSQLPTITNIIISGTGAFAQINFTGSTPIPSQIIFQTIEHGEVSMEDLYPTWTLFTGVLEAYFNNARWGTTTVQGWRYRNQNDGFNGIPTVWDFPLTNIDEMREAILAAASITNPFVLDENSPEPYQLILGTNTKNALSTQEGLALKTYQSDLFNNWLLTEWIDGTNGINAITAIDTSGGSFTIDTLNLSKKVYDMLNRIAVSGGSYDDWLDAVYVHERYTRCETPMYMGGLIKELVFQEVVSNSQSTDQPLGTLAGRGVMSSKHKGGHITIKVDEPSYIIGLISLTPRVDYSQGNKWDTQLKTMDDLHKPALDEIGFQELITEQMAWWDTVWSVGDNKWVQRSAGKQPAWINYMTNVNQTRGNFAIQTNEMFMTLNRRYEFANGITDLTTYIDPAKFNFIFAETALDAQNFWAQIAVDITARRKMSAKVMPNL